MRLEGYEVKENPNLTFRLANDKDRDIEGNKVSSDCIVFIHLDDCKITENNGKRFYDSDSATAIPISYLDTYYGMGKFKNRRVMKGVNIDGQLVYDYYQAPLYFAYNGKVYVGSLKTLPN